MQQCSGCFRFHFFKALYAAGLAWLGYLSHKCPLESHVFHPWQNDKRSRSMDNIILTDIIKLSNGVDEFPAAISMLLTVLKHCESAVQLAATATATATAFRSKGQLNLDSSSESEGRP